MTDRPHSGDAGTRARPSLEPQHLGDQSWYYETRRGIQVYHDTRRNGVVGPILIPWSRLAKSAARCGWKVKRG
jgi:hypothetical protein